MLLALARVNSSGRRGECLGGEKLRTSSTDLWELKGHDVLQVKMTWGKWQLKIFFGNFISRNFGLHDSQFDYINVQVGW